jgi:hypothetical protein
MRLPGAGPRISRPRAAAVPGVGAGRHAARARLERRHGVAVRVEALLLGEAQRVLDHGVLRHRCVQPHLDLERADDLGVRPQHLVGRAGREAREGRFDAELLRALGAMAGLGAGHEHDVRAPRRRAAAPSSVVWSTPISATQVRKPAAAPKRSASARPGSL